MSYPFIQCRWRTPTSGRRIDLVVLHTAETPEGANTAKAVANYFRTTDKKVSAHYCVDSDEIVQSCREQDVAYAAPGANHNGVQVELSGKASQTRGEWGDAYSTAMLQTAAPLVAAICQGYKIPIRYVNAPGLKAGGAGARGITTHNEVSKAFKKSTHWDPGPNFPIIDFVNLVLGGSPQEPASSRTLNIHIHLEDRVKTHDRLENLDQTGSAQWFTDIPFDKFVSVEPCHPTRPHADGRYAPGLAAQPVEDDGKIVVVITGGTPGSQARVLLTVSDG